MVTTTRIAEHRTSARMALVALGLRPRRHRVRRPAAVAPALVFAALALPAALALALPATAQAATVSSDARCWASSSDGMRLRFSGTGFAPGAPLTVAVAGRAVAYPTPPRADANGAVRLALDVPGLPRGERQRIFRLKVGDGTTSATTPPFGITRFDARYIAPTSRLPVEAKVRFTADGFVGGGRRVYLHYIQPNGQLRKTVALGALAGPCAQLTTAPRKLFPFGNVTAGGWVLRFDTRPVYRPRASIPYRERILNITERLKPPGAPSS